MEKMKLRLNQNKATFKQTSTKKKKEKEKPLKVVYISNPMWFQTSAAEFRDLVQKVTGRDSGIADDVPDAVVVPAPPAKIGVGVRRSEEPSVGDHVMEDWTMFLAPSMFFDAPASLSLVTDPLGFHSDVQ